ncbi:MAG: TonB-dependent receptor [Pseudomonadota bacterium]
MRQAFTLTALAVIFVSTQTYAQSDGGLVSEEIFVETDNRVETPLDETTRSVTVITAEELKKQRGITRNVGDILGKLVPGFGHSQELTSDFGQDLRGRSFLTLVDGVPQSTPLRDGRRSLNSIDPDLIERIEVIRGGTAIFGFGAPGGIVNIITKRPKDGVFNANGRIGTAFSLTRPVADSLSLEVAGDVSGKIGQFEYVAGASYVTRGAAFDADGDRIPADSVGIQGGISDIDSLNLFLKFGYHINDKHHIQIGGFYYDFIQDSDFSALSPTTNFLPTDVKRDALFGDPNIEDPGTENFNINLEYTGEDLFFGTDVKAQIFYTDLEVTFGRFIVPGTLIAFDQTRIENQKLGGRFTANTPIPFDIGGKEPSFTWGVDVLTDETTQIAIAPTTDDRDPSGDQFAYAFFGQLEVPFGTFAKISGGVRHERISLDISESINTALIDPMTNPTGTVPGGTIKLSDTLFNITGTVFATDEISFYGGFSQGFTTGDILRVVSDQLFANATEASAEVQRTNNYELGARYNDEMFSAEIVGFFSRSDNGTSFDENLNILTQPERIFGVEFSGSAQVLDELKIGGTVAWQEGETDTNNDGNFDQDLPSTRIAPLKVTGFVEYQPVNWADLRLQVTYTGSRSPNTVDLAPGLAPFGGTSDIDSYTLVDLYAALEVGPGQVELGITNLLNADYSPVVNQAFAGDFANSRGPGIAGSLAYRVEFE